MIGHQGVLIRSVLQIFAFSLSFRRQRLQPLYKVDEMYEYFKYAYTIEIAAIFYA